MPIALTEAEQKILRLLWDQSPQTMRQLTEALEGETHWTKYTVITLLKRMQQKGTVVVDGSGAVKTYAPNVSREAIATEQTRSLLARMFSGKASLLVSNLVEQGDVSETELQELAEILKKAQKK